MSSKTSHRFYQSTSRASVSTNGPRVIEPPNANTLVVMAPAASPSDWYNSLPPVSKAWGTACFACTLLSQFGLVDLRNLYLNWALVKGKFQVWRLLTNFCFLGKFSFPFLMRMMMM